MHFNGQIARESGQFVDVRARTPLSREATVQRHAVSDFFQEAVTVFFLTAGPALGAAIALAWLIGLIYGTITALLR